MEEDDDRLKFLDEIYEGGDSIIPSLVIVSAVLTICGLAVAFGRMW